MTIYTIDPKNNRTILTALILLKFADENSFIKIFSLLSALYNFSPTCVTIDFNFSKINTLKKTESFKKKPYIICCLFHYAQTIIKKMEKLNILSFNMTKRSIEILRNLEILCFLDKNRIAKYYNILKDEISNNENEKNLMIHTEKYWLKKYKDLYSYGQLIKDIINLKNNYINNEGSIQSENNLISKLKSLDKVYFTNNICETIHSKISKYLVMEILLKVDLEIH